MPAPDHKDHEYQKYYPTFSNSPQNVFLKKRTFSELSDIFRSLFHSAIKEGKSKQLKDCTWLSVKLNSTDFSLNCCEITQVTKKSGKCQPF